MRAILAVLLLLTLVLAGCASKGGGGDDDGSTGASTSTGSGSQSGTMSGTSSGTTSATGTGAPGANSAPTGDLSVVLNGTLATFNLTGSDLDGDSLNWELSFGDDSANATGTSLPANVTHTFAIGNFTATLNVSDGQDFDTTNVTFTVAQAAGAGTVQDATVEYTAGQGFCAGTYPEGAGGIVYGELAVDVGTIGKPFTAAWTFAGSSLGVQAIFKDAAGTTVLDASNVFVSELSGTVPDAAVTVWFSDCGPGGPAEVAYHAG